MKTRRFLVTFEVVIRAADLTKGEAALPEVEEMTAARWDDADDQPDWSAIVDSVNFQAVEVTDAG